MKDFFAKHERKFVCIKKGNDSIEYAIIIGGRAFALISYHFQECFGLDPRTGNPRIVLIEIHIAKHDPKDFAVSIAHINPAIFEGLCGILQNWSFDKHGCGTMKIGPIDCDVCILLPPTAPSSDK